MTINNVTWGYAVHAVVSAQASAPLFACSVLPSMSAWVYSRLLQQSNNMDTGLTGDIFPCEPCMSGLWCTDHLSRIYSCLLRNQLREKVTGNKGQVKALGFSSKLLTRWEKHFCINSFLCNEQKQHNQDLKNGRIITETLADTFEKRPTGIVTVAWKERAAVLSSIKSKKKKLYFPVIYWC